MTKTKVEDFLKKHNLDAYITSIDDDESDFWVTVYVSISYEDYERALEIDYTDELTNISIAWDQRSPILVPANVGDFVIPFLKHGSKKEPSVGIVTSVNKYDDGEVYYGCSFILFVLDNDFINKIYDFSLSEEDYAGYHTGFIKVLTEEEVIEILNKTIEDGYKAELERIETIKKKSQERLPQMVKSFKNYEVILSEKIKIPWDSTVDIPKDMQKEFE